MAERHSMALMDSSRIFVRNLPPNITEADFRKHFTSKGREVTDVKVIPRRRIGYIGYKTPQDATAAAKYFDRSYIRMSRIAVEIAKPISDPSLPSAREAATGDVVVAAAKKGASDSPAAKTRPDTNTKKRKRDDLDLADPKLQEFLETMQSGRNALNTLGDVARNVVPEEPCRGTEMVGLDRESDDEYEEIPARPTKRPASGGNPISRVEAFSEQPKAMPDISGDDHLASPIVQGPEDNRPGATDDDWLRSRTNRLLDLIDPDDPNTTAHHQPPMPPSAGRLPDVVMESGKTDQPAQQHGPEPARERETDRKDDPLEMIHKTSRLFVRNLPYSATEDDLRAHFETFGGLEEVHLAVGASGTSKGYALVLYSNPPSAIEAFQKSDGKPFQGRILHVLPAMPKKDTKLDEFAISKLPLKKQNLIRKKAESTSNTFNWNALYMSQDAVNTSVAARLGVSKAELLDPTSVDASVKQAIAETSIIQETKAYFASNGVDLDAFRSRQRGDTTILVKNFSYGTTVEELRKMFEEHGSVLKVLMPPSGTIAIVQFAQAPHARAAFASLAYRRFKESVLFLEKGPKDLFKDQNDNAQQPQTLSPTQNPSPVPKQKLSVAELLEREDPQDLPETSSLFVRGLNFSTTTEKLADTFRPLEGFVSARVKTKPDPKKPGKVLSMGFGFVEFRTKEQALAALKAMDGHTLEGHTLTVKASHRGMDAAEERRREDKAKKVAGQKTKIIIKNLPFETSRKDVRALFGTYGQLRAVRVPKKFGNATRGFAFVEFITPREAENALNALKDTHLLGRKLVLDFAEAEAVDAEEEIEKMQKKTGGQVNKMTLHQLTGRGRKKVTIGQEEEDEA